MNRHALAVIGLVCGLNACALNQPPRSTAAAPASPITEASVRAHMAFLASDALNGRASGSRDEWIAATYLASQMQQWALEPLGDDGGFVQTVEIERLEAAAMPTLTAGGHTFTVGKEIKMTGIGGQRVSGPLQKYKSAAAVQPGAVLLLPPLDRNAPYTPPTSTIGSAAWLWLDSPDLPKPVPPNTRPPSMPARLAGVGADQPRWTTAFLNKDAYDALAALPDGTPITIETQVKVATRTSTWNAVGRLTGSDPAAAKEVILLSAHLDHIGVRANAAAGADAINNGADDDASGTIAVLELARALALGPRPKRTIVFAFFGSEEVGGFGSRYFADKPVVPLPTIVANLQFEMIGRPDPKVPPHTLWLTGYERSTLGPSLAKQGAKLVQDPHPTQNFFQRSDNIQFARRGVVAHTVSSFGLHKEYHQPGDEIKTIDFPHMTDSIQSMLEPIQWLANSTFKPDWLPGMKP